MCGEIVPLWSGPGARAEGAGGRGGRAPRARAAEAAREVSYDQVSLLTTL